MTEPDPDRRPPPPQRPAPIELSAAILIVSGAIGLVGAFIDAANLPAGGDALFWLTLAIDGASIVLGLLLRVGRLWLLTINYVAVLGFLDLLGAGESPLSLMFGLADVLVVVLLVVHKPWFDARGRWRRGADVEPRREPEPAWRVGPRPEAAGSALDAADREAADEVALEDEEHQRDR